MGEFGLQGAVPRSRFESVTENARDSSRSRPGLHGKLGRRWGLVFHRKMNDRLFGSCRMGDREKREESEEESHGINSLELSEQSGSEVVIERPAAGAPRMTERFGGGGITDAAFFEQSGQSRVRFSDILKMRVDSKSSG